ncbi:MAG: hypothetical protein KDA80_22955 [Planctomycetaceae bacterium]|nr:hypothetical protein [Planctomycetaceae bacterium]
MLAPCDIDRIAEYLGLKETTEEFTLKMFQACDDGPEVAISERSDARAPALRPAVRADGSCVFLSDEGRCMIHPVAPFECSRVNACDPVSGAAAMKKLAQAVRDSIDYIMHWTWIRERQNG